MVITIEVSNRVCECLNDKNIATLSNRVEFLPTTFEDDRLANREINFDNYTIVEEQYMKNSLRGYTLIGEKVWIPTECVAVALEETQPPLNKASDRLLRITETFDNFTYWNYDKIPTNGDAYKQAMQVLGISNELAQPISETDVNAEMNGDELKIIQKQ